METVPPTARVKAEKVALVEPASTMTVAGSVTGSVPDRATIAPPAGAAPDSVAVPMTASPPTTLALASVIDTSAALAVTVRTEDCMLLPPVDAVIAAVPGATAVIVKVALDDPAGTVSVAGTVATAALLLVSATLAPVDGAAALNVTVPCPLAPAATLAALSVTDDSAVVGEVGDVDEPPHCIEASRPLTAIRSVIKERDCLLTCFMPDEVSTSVPRHADSIVLSKTARQQPSRLSRVAIGR